MSCPVREDFFISRLLIEIFIDNITCLRGSGNIVETLGRTGGFSAKVLQHVEKRPAYYDVPKHGIPINDLDSIGTICSFAPTVIYIGLPRQGIFMSDQEAADYIALWRLIAHYIGTPTEWFGTPSRARAIMESIMVAEINPTRMSGVLARNIIQGLKDTPPLYASAGVLEGMTRSLIGNELSDELGIGNPDILAWIFVGWVFLYAATLAYVCRSVQALDEKQVQVRE